MNGIKQPQTGFCLESTEDVCPRDQVFGRKETELLQGFKIARVLLKSTIQVGDGSVGAGGQFRLILGSGM